MFNPFKRGIPMMFLDSDGGADGGGAAGGSAGTGTTGADGSTGGSQSGDGATGGQADGESEVYTKDQVSKLIQTRVEQERGKYQKHVSLVDRIAKTVGLDIDTLEKQLEAYSKQMQSQQTGKHTPDPKVAQLEARLLDTQFMLEESQLKADPLYSDFDEVKTDVQKLAAEAGISLKQAYWFLRGEEKAKQIEKATEARVLNSRGLKPDTSKITGSDGGSEDTAGLSKEELNAASVLGMTPQEYADAKSSDNIESYRKTREARKKK